MIIEYAMCFCCGALFALGLMRAQRRKQAQTTEELRRRAIGIIRRYKYRAVFYSPHMHWDHSTTPSEFLAAVATLQPLAEHQLLLIRPDGDIAGDIKGVTRPMLWQEPYPIEGFRPEQTTTTPNPIDRRQRDWQKATRRDHNHE